ncbi:alpha-L-rhamnosidase C-terminal domain-containing protein, partial [Haloferula sp. A504]|uniref:alpha-L-rhamnosidase-related protein n=1 Tax=Haloferula sp. A504 TaxID=3373601 RepID=UPI0031C2EB8C|nr:hypothetical protein [Verrucomicrobiaceae bacterium E54]
RVDRDPPGSVRYRLADVRETGAAGEWQVVAPPRIGWNTRPHVTVPLPEAFGVVTPFRWVEIEGWSGSFDPAQVVRQSSFLKAWDEDAAHFECSDPLLNRIWDLCKYSIKATSFTGIFVDGDRERIPYEADAYINQLTHYYTDADKQLARDTFDWLMIKPTWPTEWASHMVFVAYTDWMFTGDTQWLHPRYNGLKTKLLMHRVGEDGWVHSDKKTRNRMPGVRDIVDWPQGERDGYVFREINTVVNAFHLRTVQMMAELAEALNRKGEAEIYRERFERGIKRFHEALWMEDKGCYRDGIGTDHASAHATFFPLAFGLVPEDHRDQAVAFLKTKGMACSVYAAQYLMDGLFSNGAADHALELMMADNDRSWKHMVESGTTITWEAWDQKYKPNQDWNHAWGAAPGNLLPRHVLGVEPAEAGWKRIRIKPHPAFLTSATGKVPTPHGPVSVAWEKDANNFTLACSIPEGATAEVFLPTMGTESRLTQAGPPLPVEKNGDRFSLGQVPPGSHRFTVRTSSSD